MEGDIEGRRVMALQQARRQAQDVMCRLRMLDEPDAEMSAELDEMEEFYGAIVLPGAAAASSSGGEREKTGELTLREMLGSNVHRKALALSSLAMLTPAMTGHAAIMTYGTQIFQSVGYPTSQGADLAILFQGVKLLVTLPDFIWLDAFPRRTLMSVGLIGMTGSYLVTMAAMPLHHPSLAAFAIVVSAAAYQASIGPLSWIMPTEVLPVDMRARGSALTSTLYAGAGLMVVQSYPLLAKHGPMTPLAVYAFGTTVALALNHWKLPETMGLSLEAIEREAFREEAQERRMSARDHFQEGLRQSGVTTS